MTFVQRFDQSHLQQFGDIVNKDGHKPHLTWPHKVLNLAKWQGFTCNTNSENSQQKQHSTHIFCFPKPSCEWFPSPWRLDLNKFNNNPSPLTPFICVAKPQGAGHRGVGIGISRGHAQTMDRLAEPEDPHGLTSWGLTALEATVLPREANFRTKCLNFLHFLQKMPFVHFPASKKPIQLHTQIMVEMAPEIGHRDTSQIISSNVKDTTQYIGNQPEPTTL